MKRERENEEDKYYGDVKRVRDTKEKKGVGRWRRRRGEEVKRLKHNSSLRRKRKQRGILEENGELQNK